MSNGMARRRARLAEAQDGICPECTLPLPEDLAATEVDHIIPKVRGGPDRSWNRRLIHFLCNRRKRDHLTGEAAALAVEYGLTLIEPPKRGTVRIAFPDSGDQAPEIPWWSWRRHLDCGRYDPESGLVVPSETACETCAGMGDASDA